MHLVTLFFMNVFRPSQVEDKNLHQLADAALNHSSLASESASQKTDSG